MIRLLRRPILTSVLMLLLVPLTQVLSLTTPSTAEAASASVYWGAYIKGDTYGYGDAPWDSRTIDTFEAHANKHISILHWGQPWYWGSQGGYQPFATDVAEQVRLRGSIPMITWTSEDLDQGNSTNQPNFQLAKITSGQHDAYIHQWARDAKTWGYPFFVRFDYEMSGSWYNWSEYKNGNSKGQFVPMWQHVVNIFKQEGATNVTWIWAPNTIYPGAIPLASVYPGDNYVDWLGISGYNWGTNPAAPPNKWKTFAEVFQQTYNALQQLAGTKPIMLAETASSEYGGSKASWITDMLQKQLPTKFPKVKAFIWFNWNAPSNYGYMDWVIESSSAAQSAFANGIAANYYATNTYAMLTPLTKVAPLSSVRR